MKDFTECFLVVDRHKTPLREKKAGLKTPLTLKMNRYEGMDDYFVSTSRGEILCVQAAQDFVLTNFFEADPETFDPYTLHAEVMTTILNQAQQKGWSNHWETDTLNPKDLKDVSAYFQEYDLDLLQAFVGPKAYQHLTDNEMLYDVRNPTEKEPVLTSDFEAVFGSQNEAYFAAAFADPAVAVFLNPHLDDLIVFSTRPEYIGILTRVGSYASLFVHNAERALVFARIKE